VLQAIKDTKVDMTVWPAVYIDDNETSNTAQMLDIKQAIENYGTDHIEGVCLHSIRSGDPS
jgi:glucan 1,3-beta-glucosidase